MHRLLSQTIRPFCCTRRLLCAGMLAAYTVSTIGLPLFSLPDRHDRPVPRGCACSDRLKSNGSCCCRQPRPDRKLSRKDSEQRGGETDDKPAAAHSCCRSDEKTSTVRSSAVKGCGENDVKQRGPSKSKTAAGPTVSACLCDDGPSPELLVSADPRLLPPPAKLRSPQQRAVSPPGGDSAPPQPLLLPETPPPEAGRG